MTTSQHDDSVGKQARVTLANIDFEHESTTDPPENFLISHLQHMRPRSLSHHLSAKKIPSRRWLKIQAHFWRLMMRIGMQFHDFAPPTPPKASYIRKIPTDTIPIELHIYLPATYHTTLASTPSHHFPAVVNFHGGGFTMGHPTDDRYWSRVVMEHTSAIFISVGYRKAPEHPFPIPVDDGVEALLYISDHAHDLHIDPSQIALSGFSAGANLAFTVPLRLTYHRRPKVNSNPPSTTLSPVTTNTNFSGLKSESTSSANTPTTSSANLPLLTNTNTNPNHNLRIRSIVAWYPLLDWTKSRSDKKRTSRNPSKCLPKTFTDLFDNSYLPPPDPSNSHASPYASPALAPTHMLSAGLPKDIQMWLCEWDMLLAEGQSFSARLEKLGGKNVETKIIPRVPHGWDKSPNPFRDQSAIDALYEKAARGLKEVFESPDGLHSPSSSLGENAGLGDTDAAAKKAVLDNLPKRRILPTGGG